MRITIVTGGDGKPVVQVEGNEINSQDPGSVVKAYQTTVALLAKTPAKIPAKVSVTRKTSK